MRRAVNTSNRRMGPVGSTTWHAMLDAAEAILREEGYASLTSRNVAERTGVKQRLVYYYFQTMDDLIVDTFQRSAAGTLERLRAACTTERPLAELWELCIHSEDSRLVSEFMALANRIERLRMEVIGFITASRMLQVEALTAAFARTGSTIRLPPTALALLATSVALAMNREADLGIDLGHRDMAAVVDALLAKLEPEDDHPATRAAALGKAAPQPDGSAA